MENHHPDADHDPHGDRHHLGHLVVHRGVGSLLPEAGEQDGQHGENLQAAGHHQEREVPLGEIGKAGEIPYGAQRAQALPHVAQRGDHRPDGLLEGHPVERQDEAAEDDQAQVDEGERQYLMHHVGGDGVPVDAHRHDGARVGLLLEDVEQVLREDHDAPRLQAAARGAGASAHHHQHQRHEPEERPPRDEIGGIEARGGYQRRYLEEGQAEGALRVALDAPRIQVEGRDKDGARHDGVEPARLLVPPQLAQLALEGEVDERHVRGAHAHENGDDVLDVGRVPVAHAGVPGGEPPGGDGGHGVVDGVEQVHRPQPEEEGDQDGEEQVDAPQALGDLGDPRPEALVSDARGLGVVELDGAPAEDGHQGHGEDDHADAALPLDQAPPEEDAAGQRLHVGQDGGARGGES